MNDNKINYPIGELPQSASQSSQAVDEIAEKKRNQKKSLIKLGAMGVLTAIIIIVGSVAWFTMSREVEGSGVQMKSTGEDFEISSPTGENRSAGSWYNPYHLKIMGASENENNANIPSDVWLLTNESNFGNYQSNDGIKPGSYGKITFNVTPLIDTIDMQFAFDVVGYHSSDSVFNDQDDDEEEEQELTVTPLADMGDRTEHLFMKPRQIRLLMKLPPQTPY